MLILLFGMYWRVNAQTQFTYLFQIQQTMHESQVGYMHGSGWWGQNKLPYWDAGK